MTDQYWKELSRTEDTLVFYMSSETLDQMVEKLVANNIDDDKWLAVIEQATTPNQHVYACSVREYAKKLGGKNYISPSLVIIGKVVRLHEQFKWLANDKANTEYFEEIQGKWIATKTKAASA